MANPDKLDLSGIAKLQAFTFLLEIAKEIGITIRQEIFTNERLQGALPLSIFGTTEWHLLFTMDKVVTLTNIDYKTKKELIKVEDYDQLLLNYFGNAPFLEEEKKLIIIELILKYKEVEKHYEGELDTKTDLFANFLS